MYINPLLSNFFKNLKPFELPPQFLASLSYEDENGETISIFGKDIVTFMNSNKHSNLEFFHTRINVGLIMEAIQLESDYIMKEASK